MEPLVKSSFLTIFPQQGPIHIRRAPSRLSKPIRGIGRPYLPIASYARLRVAPALRGGELVVGDAVHELTRLQDEGVMLTGRSLQRNKMRKIDAKLRSSHLRREGHVQRDLFFRVLAACVVIAADRVKGCMPSASKRSGKSLQERCLKHGDYVPRDAQHEATSANIETSQTSLRGNPLQQGVLVPWWQKAVATKYLHL
eukprot:scaffold145259_cov18-Tisochrysis_lutea.AAC.1